MLKISICLLVLAAAAFAQSDRGTITGTISDPAGAVVQSANIEVKSQDNGQVFRGGTSATGNYVISAPAGRYSLTVTVAGFKKYVRENLTVAVATDTRQDVTLEVGAATESVTVTEEAPLLKTESGEVSHNVTSEDEDTLPVVSFTPGTSFAASGFGNIRDPLAISQILPGVVYAVDGGISVNGLPASTEAIRIEGQDATNGLWNQKTQMIQSGVDAIQEVAIQTSNFAAEYGQAAGGYFNYTMKSGTNQYHGSLYTYVVNEAFNAGLPFTDAGLSNSLKDDQHIRNPQRRFDYGGTFGGAIKIPKIYDGHNKSFFFFNLERYQEKQDFASFLGTAPTAAYRQGNFSLAELAFFGPLGGPGVTDAAGQTLFRDEIFDPNTTRTINGDVVRTPFPNNIIPPSRIDPVAANIQNLIPMPNLPGNVNNYVIPTYSNYQHTDNYSFKLDHSLSPTIKLSGYFSHILTFNPGNNGVVPQILSQPNPTNIRSSTVRINYDQSLKPTLLLHLGVGYLYTFNPSQDPQFNESSLGLNGYYAPYFPNISGLDDFFSGGVNLSSSIFGGGGLGPNAFLQNEWDQKPTANANLTWIKGNHTFKFGGEMMVEGFPDISNDRSNGGFGFGSTETGDPDENRLGLNAGTGLTGFPYASFFLGQVDNLNINPPQQSKLGYHSFGLYAQDSWKVTKKLTLDYGLRYDYQTYLKEQYGRMPDTVFNVPNPAVGGRLGATLFEGYGNGRCNCVFSHNYPYAFGPRIGFAYQVIPKTVLRGGFGIQYGQAPNNAQISLNDTVFYAVSGPGYGLPFMQFSAGNPFAPGNPQGNAPLVYPNFNEGVFPVEVGGQLVPDSPFINIDKSSRPPRIETWSLGVQRELTRNLVLEVTYLGDRGAYFTAPELDATDYNALQFSDLARWGLNIHNAADQQLLLTPISSPTVIQRFPWLANPASVYQGFPTTQTFNQVIRPAPQFDGVPPFLGPPTGDTWYEALQTHLTKRFSHGLSAQGSFTWNKNEVLGTSAATQYFTPGLPTVNDVYNVGQNKQLAQLGAPLAIVISGSYVTPRWSGNKLVSNVLGGWQVGALLRYQSGALIEVADSTNNLLTELDRGPSNNPALWGGGTTYDNIVPGQSFFLINPNQKGFDPTKQLALNPAAFVDPGPGNFGASAPFYNNYRWQRQPMENMNFGRNFRMGKEGRYNLNVRVEFQNVFNRLFYSAPSAGGLFGGTPITTPTANLNPFPNGSPGALSAGYGYVNWLNGAGDQPRSGQAVARFTF
ncbi:MAG TPA: TonB-dependent receptor [Bryobacteraceae bacterium]